MKKFLCLLLLTSLLVSGFVVYAKNSNSEQNIDCTESSRIAAVSNQAATQHIIGDCNNDGKVNNKDVVILFRYVSNDKKIDDESVYDFNGDKKVDNKDVVSLFRAVTSGIFIPDIDEATDTEEIPDDSSDVELIDMEITKNIDDYDKIASSDAQIWQCKQHQAWHQKPEVVKPYT